MSRIRAVIFDLDNVLYPEEDYILAAYGEIAGFLSSKCSVSKKDIYGKLVSDWRKKSSMYPRLFNDLVADLGLKQELVPELLRIYAIRSNCRPSGVPGDSWRKRIKAGSVTNGNVEAQRNKVHLLGIEEFFDVVVYAREKGKESEKPNPEAYQGVLDLLHVAPEETVCVGDNPHTDFWGAKKLGLRTVRLLLGEFKDVKLAVEYESDIAIRTLDDS
jgi:putative hydrolase of the HAD superfamily